MNQEGKKQLIDGMLSHADDSSTPSTQAVTEDIFRSIEKGEHIMLQAKLRNMAHLNRSTMQSEMSDNHTS